MFNNHWSHSVHHDGSPSYVVCNDYTLGASVTLRLRVDIDAPIEHIFVRSSPDGEQRMTPMQVKTTHGVYRVWETKIQLHMPRTNYRFFLLTAEGNWWFTS
ncbi:MAG: alpha amylase N-terminal ig-like domain-containing protein, partial [Ktedonobacteraceae bacterium]|nr:alpha amylase N-terminal ig-like domain-containing protein [Ktedonobacteraceae bacterium]